MPGFPIQFSEEKAAQMRLAASEEGLKMRPWVMKLIDEALERRRVENAPPPAPTRWWFKLTDGRILAHSGDKPIDAWQGLGFKYEQVDLIAERLPEKDAIEAGWRCSEGRSMATGESFVAEITLAPATNGAHQEDDLPFNL